MSKIYRLPVIFSLLRPVLSYLDQEHEQGSKEAPWPSIKKCRDFWEGHVGNTSQRMVTELRF